MKTRTVLPTVFGVSGLAAVAGVVKATGGSVAGSIVAVAGIVLLGVLAIVFYRSANRTLLSAELSSAKRVEAARAEAESQKRELATYKDSVAKAIKQLWQLHTDLKQAVLNTPQKAEQ